MRLLIHPDGHVTCLYDEAIDLASLGSLAVSRASHVEPDEAGQWHADLSPVGGPTLGTFVLRSDALDAEREWLEANWLTAPRDI